MAVDPHARAKGLGAVTAKKRTRRRAAAAPMKVSAVRAGRRSVELTNTGKVLFPDDGITKGDLAEYYQSVAKWMVPHLRDRPIAMERYPDGIDGMRFFQKNASKHFPDWITRARVPKVIRVQFYSASSRSRH